MTENTTVVNTVRCALKTRVLPLSPPSGSVCSLRLLASLPAAFWEFGGFFVGFYSVLVLAPQSREYSLYHGTDIQINSTGCFSLHYSCKLSLELSSSQVGCTCYISLPLYFIHFFFNNGKITWHSAEPKVSLSFFIPNLSSPPKKKKKF